MDKSNEVVLTEVSRKPGPGNKPDAIRYAVTVDGEMVGHVERYYSESYRQMPSGVRYGFRGYSTTWISDPIVFGQRTDFHHHTRAAAVGRLMELAR